MKKVVFNENSRVDKLCDSTFSGSAVESINIPESVVSLDEGWCKMTNELINVEISPKSERFSHYENFLLGKSDLTSDVFDILLFAPRNIEYVFIPQFIKIIDSCAFNCCMKIKNIEFPHDSKLESIGTSSFSYSSIKSFTFPSIIDKIQDQTFSFCNKLKKVEFPLDTKMKSFE